MLALLQSGISLSPCSPAMNAWTFCVATFRRCAMRKRKRELSSTVPLPKTRWRGRPLSFSAAYVSTSTGFVTTR